MATARVINVYPSFALETVVELLNDERPHTGRRLNVAMVAEEVLRVNRELAAFAQDVAAGAENIPIAPRALLDPVPSEPPGLQIDEVAAGATRFPP